MSDKVNRKITWYVTLWVYILTVCYLATFKNSLWIFMMFLILGWFFYDLMRILAEKEKSSGQGE